MVLTVLLNIRSDGTGQQSRWNVKHPDYFLLIFSYSYHFKIFAALIESQNFLLL